MEFSGGALSVSFTILIGNGPAMVWNDFEVHAGFWQLEDPAPRKHRAVHMQVWRTPHWFGID